MNRSTFFFVFVFLFPKFRRFRSLSCPIETRLHRPQKKPYKLPSNSRSLAQIEFPERSFSNKNDVEYGGHCAIRDQPCGNNADRAHRYAVCRRGEPGPYRDRVRSIGYRTAVEEGGCVEERLFGFERNGFSFLSASFHYHGQQQTQRLEEI